MQLSQSLLYFSLMVSLSFVVLSGQETHQQPPVSSPEDTEQCVTCDVRQHIKTMRLNAIKSQILSKLRMKEAPNISRDTVKQLLPKAPPLQQLLDQYDVLGDDNRDAVTEEDDEHAITETIMVMATERKCFDCCGARREKCAKVSKTVYARSRAHGGDGIINQDCRFNTSEIVMLRLVDRVLLFVEGIRSSTVARRLICDSARSLLSAAASVVQVNAEPKCCFFAFTQKFQASRLVRAQLWVHLRPATEATTVFLQISRLMPVTDGNRHIRIRSLKLDVKAGVGSWQSIDVKQVLSVWLRQPETNWGIEINAFDSRGKDLAVTSTQPGEEGLVS